MATSKKSKIVNNLIICDNKYNILAISDCIEGHHHDSFELIQKVQNMIDSMKKQSIEYHFSHLNADSRFDVKLFLSFIEQMEMIPNIKQNKRNSNNSAYSWGITQISGKFALLLYIQDKKRFKN